MRPVTRSMGIDFQYVPMMTAETPVSLSLLDRSAIAAEALLSGSVLRLGRKVLFIVETRRGIQIPNLR
jgi:hypothetical protein